MIIRDYSPKTDYESVKKLYMDSSLYGGQFDDARDGEERLKDLITGKPGSIIVVEDGGAIIGTVTLFEDGRSAWLYRFAVQGGNEKVADTLWAKAKEALKQMGHSQVLVYAPSGDKGFEKRYVGLGFKKGNDFTVYWQNI